jgi:ubiquinone/menaquinone biosynthesis C-methylase UbiE
MAIQKNWSAIEYFDKEWASRIAAMARHVPAGSSVMDLGCGPMWLKAARPDLNYTGIDYTFRGTGSIVADFNRKQFPTKQCDVAFVSGCLEYVRYPRWFIAQITRMANRCVMSYCVVDIYDNLAARRRAAWVSDLSKADIECLFRSEGFSLSAQYEHDGNTIFVFDRNTVGTT